MLVATVFYTGLRISEMLGLLWKDVDFDAGVAGDGREQRREPRPSKPRLLHCRKEAQANVGRRTTAPRPTRASAPRYLRRRLGSTSESEPSLQHHARKSQRKRLP